MPEHAHQQTDQRAQNAQYYLRVLHELIDLGTDLARQAHRQALLPAEATPLPPKTLDPTAKFDLIMRGLRRSVMLAHKLTEPEHGHAAPNHRSPAHNRVIRALEDDLQRTIEGDDEAERLHAESLDRLDRPDLADDLASLPDEVLEDICRDFGIPHIPLTSPSRRHTQAVRPAHAATNIRPEAQAPRPPPPSNSQLHPPTATVSVRPPDPWPLPPGHCQSTDPP